MLILIITYLQIISNTLSTRYGDGSNALDINQYYSKSGKVFTDFSHENKFESENNAAEFLLNDHLSTFLTKTCLFLSRLPFV